MEDPCPTLVERANLKAPVAASGQEQQRGRGTHDGGGAEHQARGCAAQGVLESQN
jgi:hypothetical protein